MRFVLFYYNIVFVSLIIFVLIDRYVGLELKTKGDQLTLVHRMGVCMCDLGIS